MDYNSTHNRLTFILKNLNRIKNQKQNYYKNYDKSWKLLEKFYKDYNKEYFIKEMALNKLSILKKA